MNKIRKIILIFIIISLIFANTVFAVSQSITTDINSIDSNQYPQIKEMIQDLKNAHPNWNFKILYTDIEWKDAIANEYVGHGDSPKNLVPANNSNYDANWVCNVCGTGKLYDSGNWYCASESAISYMMDARNSLNYNDIFQFMELTYTECSFDSLKAMVSGTFLDNDSYINAIMNAGRTHNVNTYYIVARIIQEQGRNGSTLSLGQGYNGQYVGYYNAFNIGASGNGKETVILNGLKKAESYGWTSLESSIIGGTEIIAKNYISRGQNTLYLQKFDVDNSDGNLYWHQYMQNLLAAQSEGSTLRRTFEDIGSIESAYTFIIPVFKNMPLTASPRPSDNNVEIPENSDLVRVNVTGTLYLRDAARKDANKIGTVSRDEIITRLEKATQKVDGTYWDYVMKSDGTRGYAARETFDYESTYKLYLVPLNPEVPDEPENPVTPENPEDIVKNDKIKLNTKSNEVTTVPNATAKDFADLLGSEVVVKNSNGETLATDAKLGTGYTINDTYTVAVLGDVNGDGNVKSTDYMQIKNYIMENKEFTEVEKRAADVNNNNEIKATDYMKIKNYIMGSSTINIK